jgi:hypothetical protein
MTFQMHATNNVVEFPGVHRRRAQIAMERPQARSPRRERAVALSGAEVNVRLLILLGICTSSAAIILTATHILQGL